MNRPPARRSLTRRQFVRQSALLAGAAAWGGCVSPHSRPRRVSPNEKLNLAFIGAGGRAGANLEELQGENVVALCDVNEENLNAAAKKYPHARKYFDFRRLYDEAGDVDAVVVSTTEHTHAFAVLPALKSGKHVYCEKPLAHTVWETRL